MASLVTIRIYADEEVRGGQIQILRARLPGMFYIIRARLPGMFIRGACSSTGNIAGDVFGALVFGRILGWVNVHGACIAPAGGPPYLWSGLVPGAVLVGSCIRLPTPVVWSRQ